MRFSTLALPVFLGLPLVSAGPLAARSDADVLLDLNAQAREALEAQLSNSTTEARSTKCNLFNAKVRRDWKFFSCAQRKEYIAAVKCLQKKPSIASPTFAPGAKTRYDDFVAVHINQTLSIHGTGNFLTWHRYYVKAYETALRTDTGTGWTTGKT
ncbi:hypothetical protein NUW58_g3173 [Xylaria curta]|uniref:Uncharacterized protein n=1 Tax=Xylaria curta TaxID=42375 RepID=A0ACC1PCP6_9PEZI|nr:hypothetical protein NUW58_g3173 [Xylaria curta]